MDLTAVLLAVSYYCVFCVVFSFVGFGNLVIEAEIQVTEHTCRLGAL